MIGVCFRELIIGKSTILDFYNPTSQTSPEEQHIHSLRTAALSTFQTFVDTAEHVVRAMRHKEQPNLAKWPGYTDEDLEKLRRGISGDEIEVLDALRAARTRSIEDAEMKQRHYDELKQMRKQEKKTMRKLVAEKMGEDEGKTWTGDISGTTRPVVTFMWRSEYR